MDDGETNQYNAMLFPSTDFGTNFQPLVLSSFVGC